MPQDMHGAGGRGNRPATDPGLSRAYVAAFVVAAAATCLGGIAAVAAVSSGASALASWSLMAGCVVAGVLAATVVVHRAGRRNRDPASTGATLATGPARPRDRRQRRHDRRQLRRDRRAMRRTSVCSPAIMLEEELSVRYGVPVERVAGHVWRIDGELVEATLDPVTGQLIQGGRELQL